MKDILPDLFDLHADKLQWLPFQFVDYGARPVFEGYIKTVQCFQDNTWVKSSLAESGDDRVLLVDGGGSLNRALLGDLIANSAVLNHWAGIVIVGAVRDVAELTRMDIGIKALGACPIKTERRGFGQSDCDLYFNQSPVRTGDYLYADRNGVAISRCKL